ncbi:hypothetical protein C0993_006064, partial [Termitomyces sp. T159_Od127]
HCLHRQYAKENQVLQNSDVPPRPSPKKVSTRRVPRPQAGEEPTDSCMVFRFEYLLMRFQASPSSATPTSASNPAQKFALQSL